LINVNLISDFLGNIVFNYIETLILKHKYVISLFLLLCHTKFSTVVFLRQLNNAIKYEKLMVVCNIKDKNLEQKNMNLLFQNFFIQMK